MLYLNKIFSLNFAHSRLLLVAFHLEQRQKLFLDITDSKIL